MAEVQMLVKSADWQALRVDAAPVMLFKHSTTCPISARAHDQFHRWAAAQPAGALKPAQVRVIEERPISQQIALDTGVQHASPQALLLHRGKVLWHASHQQITEAALAAAVAQAAL